jgi:hypothetical protein
MRILVAVILFAHALAHLPGFVVPWRLAVLDAMPYRTTLFGGHVDVGDAGIRVVGAFWLVAALAVAVAGVAVLARAPWWWAATVIAASLSLALSVAGWPQARIGVFVNTAIIVVVLIGGAAGRLG